MAKSFESVVEFYPEITGVHEACLAVPDISDEDFESLCSDIASNGLRHEIVLTKSGELIDGRNRLRACYLAQVEPRFKHVSTDPWQVACSENIARRHLDVKQKAAFAQRWMDAEAAEAKRRQEATQAKPGEKIGGGNISTTLNESGTVHSGKEWGKARDKVGARVGVSGKSVDKAALVAEYAPEKLADDSSLEQAFKEAKRRQKAQAAVPVDLVPKPTQAMTKIVTAKGVVSEIALPKKTIFNHTNDSVDWARYTWNPVTGCEHGCQFCYAREIANSQRMAAVYPNKFEPTFHEYRLDAPANTVLPKTDDERDGRVFVCSMADLFGKWVPDSWIKAVFHACLESPEWEYLFLTKWPARYAKMPLLKKAWYGASVIQQSDVARVEKAMQNFETDCVKWISLEPMLGPIQFSSLEWCDLVVIGGQTSTSQPDGFVPEFSPEFDWVVDVVNQCREAGVPYYVKENLGLSRPGMKLPKPLPRR